MTTLIERALTTLRSLTTYMGSNNNPLPTYNHPYGDQENQAVVIYSGQNKHEVVETDTAHVSEDSKTSPSRGRTDLTFHKNSAQIRQEPRKPNARPRAEHSLPRNTRYRSRSLADENVSLETQLDGERRDLVQVTKQSKEFQRKLQKLMGEKEDLHASIRVERDGFFRVKMDAEKQIRDLQAKNQKLEGELRMLKGKLHGVQEKHLHTAKLLEERTADLKGAQTFLTTADRYAGAEIVKMVEALNAEIFQGAALISELLEDETTILKVDERTKVAEGTRSERDYLAQYIGLALGEYLSTKSKQVQVDPLPLQLAVQTILTSWCVFMVNNFCVGPASDILREIYRHIWESQPQAVAGRWRAMTMGQVKHLDSTTHLDVVIKMLSTLLGLCGSSVANLNSQKTGLCLRQVVSTIVHMWMPLRIAIYEGITTTEMQVFCAHPNVKYQPAEMDDIYADTEDVQQSELGRGEGHILCTVGMGLQRSIVKRNLDGTLSVQKDIVLKAKVAFPSVLFDSA